MRENLSKRNPADLIKCTICEKYVEGNKTFVCKNCRRSLICLEHFDREYKVCLSCATEKRMKLYNDLLRQERNINGFLMFNQFIFLLSFIVFFLKKIFTDYIPEFIDKSILTEYYLHVGVVAFIGIIICYFLKFSQKSRIEEIKYKINEFKVRK